MGLFKSSLFGEITGKTGHKQKVTHQGLHGKYLKPLIRVDVVL